MDIIHIKQEQDLKINFTHSQALSSFILIILLVGISHVGKMLSLLHNDMEDDAERRGFYDVSYGDQLTFHEGEVISTNNQRRFAKAQHLASGKRISVRSITCSLEGSDSEVRPPLV